MRRALFTILVVVLLAPDASAQVAAVPSSRLDPMQVETAAQATFDTSYLLALYMTQLAAAGSAPSQADIDEAARQYLTNGAAVTSVPSNGPAAAYFQNGAAVTGVPTSGPGAAYFQNGAEVTAYYAAPQAAPASVATSAATSPTVAASSEQADGVPPATESVGNPVPMEAAPVARAEVSAKTTRATELACSPLEIEAAMAIAAQFASAAASPPAITSCMPLTSSTDVPRPAEATAPRAAEPTASCPPASCPRSTASPWSRVVSALAGAILGGLAVALWSRPRAFRVPQHRQVGL